MKEERYKAENKIVNSDKIELKIESPKEEGEDSTYDIKPESYSISNSEDNTQNN